MMTLDELRELIRNAVTTDVVTAGRAYGFGRATSYDLARRGEFPVQVLKVGTRYRVRTALLAVDLLQSETEPTSADSAPTTTNPGQEIGSHDPNCNPLRLV